MNKREAWIDICKGLLISTIVLFHISYPFNEYIAKLTGLYKVLVFFCLAGLTLKDDKLIDTQKFITNKIFRLYSKIVLVGVIAVLLHNTFINTNIYSLNTDYYGKMMNIYNVKDCIKQIILTSLMANREVIIGPMWYANVLFMALIIISILDFISRKIVRVGDSRRVRFLFCVGLLILSYVLSYIVGITIPRFNNTLTAVFLIDFCQLLYTRYHFKFNNTFVFAINLLVLLALPIFGVIELNLNLIVNPIYLVTCAFSGMYVMFYISKLLERTISFNKLFSTIGKYSFYIMALHFFSFKIGSMIIGNDISLLTPVAGNIFEVIFYFIIGVSIPCLVGKLFNFLHYLWR